MAHYIISVNWSKNDRTTRLLDWLDAHPLERSVLFTPPTMCPGPRAQRPLTKRICGERAAVTILAVDEDINLRFQSAENPRYYGGLVTRYITKLRVKYQQFNTLVGIEVANTDYRDIQDRTVLQKIEKLMTKEFPEWGRLHQYWRTIQYYNQYWKAPSMKLSIRPTNPALPDRVLGLISGTTTRTRRHAIKVEAARVKMHQYIPRSEVIIISDDESPEPEDCSHKQSGSKISSKSDRQRKQAVIPFSNTQNSRGEDRSLTDAHRLELQIEIKKLDLQRAQMEAEARREKEQHEIRMKLTAFVTRGADGSL